MNTAWANQAPKQTPKALASRQALLRDKPSMFAATRCRGLSLSR